MKTLKYYWINYIQTLSGGGDVSIHIQEEVIDRHPFEEMEHMKQIEEEIVEKNTGAIYAHEISGEERTVLLNWKEITKEEFDMWKEKLEERYLSFSIR